MFSSVAGARATSVDDQLWSEFDASHSFSADLSATAIFTSRVGNDLPNPTLAASGVQIDYRFGSWIGSTTGYYIVIRNSKTGAGTSLWLPAIALSYQVEVGALSLADRNRIEQLEGLPGSPTRYRNRASLYWHAPASTFAPDVFVADEVFYDFSKGGWTRNRAQAGIQFHVEKRTSLQVIYLRQNTTYGTPDRLNVLGLTLQIDIK